MSKTMCARVVGMGWGLEYRLAAPKGKENAEGRTTARRHAQDRKLLQPSTLKEIKMYHSFLKCHSNSALNSDLTSTWWHQLIQRLVFELLAENAS